MNKLIGFNLIQTVVWFILIMMATSKTGDWEHFKSNWFILTVLTGTISVGVYYLVK